MSTYNYTVQLVVSPDSGAGAIPAEVEAEKVALFLILLRNLSIHFGIGKAVVTATLVP